LNSLDRGEGGGFHGGKKKLHLEKTGRTKNPTLGKKKKFYHENPSPGKKIMQPIGGTGNKNLLKKRDKL